MLKGNNHERPDNRRGKKGGGRTKERLSRIQDRIYQEKADKTKVEIEKDTPTRSDDESFEEYTERVKKYYRDKGLN